MAKSRSAPTQQATSGDNFKWTCMIDSCTSTGDGFSDMETAAASASEHYISIHSESGVSPSFSYENLNPPPDPVPDTTFQDIWDAIPDGKPLTKSDIAALHGMH